MSARQVLGRLSGCTLELFGTSDWPLLPLNENLWMSDAAWLDEWPELQGGVPPAQRRLLGTGKGKVREADVERVPKVRVLKRAALFLGLEPGMFYHFLLAALPRLVLLLPALHADPSIKILLPEAPQPHQRRREVAKELTAANASRASVSAGGGGGGDSGDRGDRGDRGDSGDSSGGGGSAAAAEDAREGSFALQLLSLLLPSEWLNGPSRRVVSYPRGRGLPGERLVVSERLLWADWEPTRHADGQPLYAVAPHQAIRATAALLVDGLSRAPLAARTAADVSERIQAAATAPEAGGWRAAKGPGWQPNGGAAEAAEAAEAAAVATESTVPVVVYAARGASLRSRGLANATHTALAKGLATLAARFGAAFALSDVACQRYSAVETDQCVQWEPKATLRLARLYRRALVVVGVHGAALSNAIFCRPGTGVVELSHALPAIGRPYASLAAALGLEYHSVGLLPDARGPAQEVVDLPTGGVEHVLALVQARLVDHFGAGLQPHERGAAPGLRDELR